MLRYSSTVFVLFLACSVSVFGRGKAEEEVKEDLNPRWVLCLTSFDVSSLPSAQHIVGDVLIRNLVKSIMDVHHRIRPSVEYGYYKDLAWVRNLEDAGKKLSDKRSERDLLLYKGYPGWRYKSELKTLEGEIKTLEEAYKEAEEAVMKVAGEPVFQLSEENAAGTFPLSPAAGAEYYYCVNKKADAFVSGEISEFHGRIFLRIRMYTLYTRSFEYEDTFIFSTNDMGLIEEEMAGRLMAAISGAAPSAISVKTDPESAVILVKERYAGQGDTGIREYPPGPADVVVFADGYTGAAASVDITEGELTEMEFKLQPIPETSFDIDFPSHRGTSIYQGSLYLGEAPLTIKAPLNQFEYIHAETSAGDTAAVVFRAGQTGNVVNLPISSPAQGDPKPLGTARRKFYGAWTLFWIALPAAFMLSGNAATYKNAYTYAGYPDVGKSYDIWNGASTGAWIVFGAAAAYSIYRMIRYGHTASKSVPRMVK
ncbi:MAG: PEGA domain-containing protein [Treponema sp.]|nr:PEGA domain-containing protein [Treponema sp.]